MNEHISEQFQQHREELADIEFRKRFLQSLYFPEINARQEEIAEAHKSTFQWIFDNASQRYYRWDNFVQWLESGHGIYWISGKAGSGKSTLMNYICKDTRTMSSLKVWSGMRGVIIPSFFFWNPGSAMQKSCTGLLRSLVSQILEAFPHLIPMLAESGKTETQSGQIVSAKHGLKLIPAWTEGRLRMTLRRINCELTSSCVCYFVDGLDEFTGSYSALTELIGDLIQNLNVKVCVSSRPYRAFETAFGGFPKLRLQDLTEQDIRTYATDRLSSLSRTKLLVAGNPSWIPETADAVLRKAEGVFLWVKLAVDDQIEGANDEDSREQLAERLQLLPSEMGDLYVHMLNKISKSHRKEAVRYLQLILNWTGDFEAEIYRPLNPSLSLIALAEYNKLDDLLRMTSEMDISDVIAHCDRTAKRIATICAGFLEISKNIVLDEQGDSASAGPGSGLFKSENFHVRFLHKTTSDFLLEDQRGKQFLDSNSTTHFSPDISYIRAQLGTLIVFEVTSRKFEGITIYRYVNKIMQSSFIAEHRTGVAHTALMDLVDTIVAKLANRYENEASPLHWCTRWTVQEDMPRHNRVKSGFGIFRWDEIEPRKSPSSWTTPTSPVDFLGLAASHGLLLYVQQKLETKRDSSHRHTASYLLWCAVIGSLSGGRPAMWHSQRLELVAMLLEQGADPNDGRSDGTTIWVHFLRYLKFYAPFFRPRWTGQHSALRNPREAFIKAVTAFLYNGANVQEIIGYSEGPVHCRPIFKESSTYIDASFVSKTGIRPKEVSFTKKVEDSARSVIERFLGDGPGLEEIQNIFIAKGVSSYSKCVLCMAFGGECPEESYVLSQQQSALLHKTYESMVYAGFTSSKQTAVEFGCVIEELYEELKNQSMESDDESDDFSNDDDEEENDGLDDRDVPVENESIYYSVPSSPHD